jgi:thymidylate kinase
VRHVPARNAVLNVVLLHWFRRAAREHATFLRSARAHIAGKATSRFDCASRICALRRQLAGDALLRAQPTDNVTLVDEGILSSIHSALVHPQQATNSAEVEDFASTMPKPDIVLHLDTPLEVCIARVLARKDPPLRWSDAHAIEEYVRNGHQAYRFAAAAPAFRGRWRTITPEIVDADLSSLAREALSFLHRVPSIP